MEDLTRRTGWLDALLSCLRALALTGFATVAAWVMDGAYSLASQAMAYLLAVVYLAFQFGRRDALICSAASVVALNFFFIPPRYTLTVEHPDYLITLGALLLVSLVVSGLATRLQTETAQARKREDRARQLHALADTLAAAGDRAQLLEHSLAALKRTFGAGSVLLWRDTSGELVGNASGETKLDSNAAQWALNEQRSIGPGTAYWPELDRWYTPLLGKDTALGIASVLASAGNSAGIEEDLRYLEVVARQIGMALQREQLTRHAQSAALEAKTESIRNALLASISHDMRTPLAAIIGSATTLSVQRDSLSGEQQGELLRNIEAEATQMSATAENILQLARLSANEVKLRRDWESIGEIIGTAVGRARRRGELRVTALIGAELPLVQVDAVLIEQALANLIENALSHAAGDTPIEVSAVARENHIVVRVEDRGPGLTHPASLFSNVHSGVQIHASAGRGLGLAICKAIVELHGGSIEALNRDGGGAVFAFTLPRANDLPLPPEAKGEK